MDKTPQERFVEIKKEIIDISESYTIVRQNMNKEAPVGYEQRHILFLQMRLNELVAELNRMTAKQEIEIPLLYKDTVNKLRRAILDNCPKEFVQVANDVEHLNEYLI